MEKIFTLALPPTQARSPARCCWRIHNTARLLSGSAAHHQRVRAVHHNPSAAANIMEVRYPCHRRGFNRLTRRLSRARQPNLPGARPFALKSRPRGGHTSVRYGTRSADSQLAEAEILLGRTPLRSVPSGGRRVSEQARASADTPLTAGTLAGLAAYGRTVTCKPEGGASC
jgi:hypothetical protein